MKIGNYVEHRDMHVNQGLRFEITDLNEERTMAEGSVYENGSYVFKWFPVEDLIFKDFPDGHFGD